MTPIRLDQTTILPPTQDRLGRILEESRRRFALDLTGLEVYTEAASGPYLGTPILAALCGAKRVHCLTRDSRWARKEDVRDATVEAARRYGVADRIHVVFERRREDIAASDIITNSGFTRPIDARMVSWMKPTAAVPLMYEPWEFRPDDIDLRACRQHGVAVLGTDEHDPRVGIFRVNPFVVAKALMDAGSAVYNDHLLLVSSGPTGDAVASGFHRLGIAFDRVAPASPPAPKDHDHLISMEQARANLHRYDIVVVWDHVTHETIIGPGGLLDTAELAAAQPAMQIIQICGGVDRASLAGAGLPVHPAAEAPPGHQTISGADLGPRPTIELYAAGLKVGERLARARLAGLSTEDATAAALREAPALPMEDLP